MPTLHSFKLLTTFALALTANAAVFDPHQGNAHVNRGLVHRHRSHQARAATDFSGVEIVPRAGAAYNESDHDTSASIEIGGQPATVSASVVVSSSTAKSVVVSTSSSVVVSSSSSSLIPTAGVTSSSSAIPSVTSTSTLIPTVADTSSSLPSSSSSSSPSSVISSSSSSSAILPSVASSSSLSASPTITSSSSSSTTQLVSTVRSTVTDSAADAITGAQTTTRGAKTAAVSIKTASASSTASAAAASSGGSSTGMSSGTKTAIIVVCVVGGIALAAFALWTIIRKWKLRPTKRFDGRMRPLDFSPTTDMSVDPFYEKTQRRHSGNSVNSTSSADRQRRQFIDELDDEQYGHHQQYDMAGLPGAGGVTAGPAGYVHGVPSHDFTAGVATSYPQDTYEQEDDGYAQLRRGPSMNNGTFAGVGAGGAGLPTIAHGPVSPMNGYAHDAEPYSNDGYAPQQGLAREPSLGRPTRGDGPYAAATHFAGSGPRY